VRAVLFDFYGTLAHATTWGPSYEEVLAGHGVMLTDDVRRRWVSDAFDGLEHVEHSVDRDAYVAWEKSRLVEMVVGCGVGTDDAARLADDLWGAGKQWSLEAFPETVAVLDELRRRSIAVVVCSNWDWDLDRALESAGISAFVDVWVTSAQAGARKPHRRIYDETLRAAGGVGPDDVVFVGDSWHADVEGPLALGMPAVHVRRPDDQRDVPSDEALPPDAHRVTDLCGVLDVLDRLGG
jgi:putative hydrolase of the HAD superfamily